MPYTVPPKLHRRELLAITKGIVRWNLEKCQAFNGIVASTRLRVAAYRFYGASCLAALVLRSAHKLFFLDAPGGSSRAFLLNLIHAYLSLRSMEVYAVATSVAAAVLLNGGRVTYLAFKILVPATEHSTCNVAANSKLVQQLREVDLAFRDEAVMCHRIYCEAVDRPLYGFR